MKISILFMCLLAVAYATNTEPKGHKDFCRYLECCSDELPCKNIPCNRPFSFFLAIEVRDAANIINIDVWKCILQRAGVKASNDEVSKQYQQ
ncbi:hypothetical protein G5I_05502 [Acromyrmex echinatior]|uniref:Uncharacterized protein n=1 Tax=Acromyrmex echinatior TaxID=103372 RepID=F4WIH8_ACREC|nr:hypothetical protein G5I_05502 [Acromyrmex echinatior]